MLLDELTMFIEEVVKNGGEVSKEEVVAFHSYHPEFERFKQYKSNWNTTTFKKVRTGLGYRINSDREGNRWLKSVNGENKDFYQLVPQEGAMKGALSTDAAEAPFEPPAPPVVENDRFRSSASVTTFRRKTNDPYRYDQTIQHQPETGGLGSVRAANSDHYCYPRTLGARP